MADTRLRSLSMMHGPSRTAAQDDAGAAASDRRRALLETLAITLVSGIAAAAGVLGLWIAASVTIRDHYSRYLTSLALTAAQQVDATAHQQLRDPGQRNSATYLQAVAPLRRMVAALPDVKYLYTMTLDGDTVRFVLDAALPGDRDGDGIEDQAGVWEQYPDSDPAMRIALGSPGQPGRAAATEQPFADKWGSFMTGWAPLLDGERQVGVLGIDVDADIYLADLRRARSLALLGLLPALLLIAALSLGFYGTRMRGLAAARAAAQAARVLSAEQLRLRNVIEGTNVGTWDVLMDEVNAAQKLITVDDRWAAMLGLTAMQLNPLHPDTFFSTLVHPEDEPEARAAVGGALLASDELFALDLRLRHAAGHWVWTEVRGKVLERNASGRPLRIGGTQMDVSARKAAERALVESESNFRSLFELSPVGIALSDLRSGRFIKINPALQASTGYSREELLRLTYWDITPPDWHQFERENLTVLQHQLNLGTYEKEYQRKDGSRYPVLISGTRMKDAEGRDVVWAIVQDISERKAMETELAEAARRDRLTGLANRTLFMERLQAAVDRVNRGEQQRFVMLFLDFDRFKLVNDALGHEAGDTLLREIAARMRATLLEPGASGHAGDNRLIARFGGDEFLVLLNDLPDMESAEQVADRLLAALARTYNVNGRDVYSTASIGIFTSEQGAENAEAVVRNADVAMYEAKRSGRACAVRFDAAMHARLTRYVLLDSSLRQALGTAEFSLVYQPIVALANSNMVSAEALVRWCHPELGEISPSEFIPVAEESGLIVALGEWVLHEACETLAGWRRDDPHRAPQSISVNVSRAELALGDRLLARVRLALQHTGLPPECLQLEVTERDVMRDPAATLKLMQSLRALGVRLAMDDFGTGTSSLACLREYPFDVVKVDRSFICDLAGSPDVLAMMHAAISLVENLGRTSVAEGVETAQQVAILQSMGCQHAQGYFFSRPLTADKLLAFTSPQASTFASRAEQA